MKRSDLLKEAIIFKEKTNINIFKFLPIWLPYESYENYTKRISSLEKIKKGEYKDDKLIRKPYESQFEYKMRILNNMDI